MFILLEGSKVTATYQGDNAPKGFIQVQNQPSEPESRVGYYPELHYSDGEFHYEYHPQEIARYTVDYDELVNTLIRKKYSLSQELAILRQKDTKPSEYSEYYSYCEDCKLQARQPIS